MLFSVLEIIDIAILIEENGENFYRETAKTMEPGAVKDTFLILAGEEAKHQGIFADITASIKNSELSENAPRENYPGEYLAYLHAFADSHVFTRQNTGLEIAKSMVSGKKVLEFAVQIELDSVLFYLEMKRFIDSGQWPIVDQIIDEERGHYLKLSNIQNAIKTDTVTNAGNQA